MQVDLWNGIAGEHLNRALVFRIEFDLHATQMEILHDGLSQQNSILETQKNEIDSHFYLSGYGVKSGYGKPGILARAPARDGSRGLKNSY